MSSQPLFGEDHPPGFVQIGAGSDYAADLLLGYGRRHDDYPITRSDERELQQVRQSSLIPSRALGRNDTSRGNIALALQIEATDTGKPVLVLSAILNLQVPIISPAERVDSMFSSYCIQEVIIAVFISWISKIRSLGWFRETNADGSPGRLIRNPYADETKQAGAPINMDSSRVRPLPEDAPIVEMLEKAQPGYC